MRRFGSGPAPTEAFDPEADDLERGGWAGRGDGESSDDGDLGMDESTTQPEVRAKEKQLRMRADIAVDSKEYAGKAVARKQLRKGGRDEDEDDDDEDEEDDDDDDEDEEEGDDVSEEQSQGEGEGDDDNEEDEEARRIEEEQDAALMRMVAASKADTGKSMHARNQRDIAGDFSFCPATHVPRHKGGCPQLSLSVKLCKSFHITKQQEKKILSTCCITCALYT